MTEISDEILLEQTLAGDLGAFEQLVARYQVFVKRVVARRVPQSAIDDVTQNALLQVFTSLSRFRGDSSFKSWMTTIVVRSCYSYHGRRAGRRETPISAYSDSEMRWLETALETGDSGEDAESKQAAREVLEHALGKLTIEDRMIIVELLVEDRPIVEVAKALGWSKGRLRVRTHRAKKRLRDAIESLIKGD